jgi:Flp pilus assembly protein TadD
LRKIFNASTKLFICLFLVAVTLAVFWPVKNYDFIHYDDDLYILNNPWVQEGLTIESTKWAFTSTHTGNWYPLTWLSVMLDYELYGLNPGGYHWSNLLFHIANTLLLFLLFTRMTGAVWKSAFVATLFALHPLHVESVAWISERKDVLSIFFWILTMGFYVNYVKKPGIITYLPVLFAFCFGLMAKSMLVTLPFVLLLMDFWPLERFPRSQSTDSMVTGNHLQMQSTVHDTSIRRLIYEKIPLLAFTIPVIIVTIIAQRQVGAMQTIESLSFDMRVANALVSYIWYISKMLIPSNLSVFYPHPGFLPMWKVILSGLFLVLISVAVLRWGRRYPYLPAGWLWYLGTLVPVIGLVHVGSQAMADRYSYIPLTGLFIMAAWGTADILKKNRYRQAILGSLALATIIGLITFTSQQLRYWQNGITLFRHNIATTAPHYTNHYNLGVHLMEKGNYEEAILEFRKALHLRPDIPTIHNNLGVCLYRKGEIPQALNEYNAALRLKPDHVNAHMNLAMLFYQQGNVESSMVHFREALRLQPKLAYAHYHLALALEKQGKVAEAKSHYEMAVRINPAYADIGFPIK